MSGRKGKGNVFSQIVVAVIVTLLVGSSAPWWWKVLFPSQLIALSSRNVIHLGDQTFPDWEAISGTCFDADFDVHLPVKTVSMQIETFGAESKNTIAINGEVVANVPLQGVKSPNEWVLAPVSISLPVEKIQEGKNTLQICAALVEVEPSFIGDKDDFQFRNLQLTIK